MYVIPGILFSPNEMYVISSVLFQALCDQQMFAKADENFKRAMTLEADNGNIYVHRG